MSRAVVTRIAFAIAFAIVLVAIIYAQQAPTNLTLIKDTTPPTIDWIGQVGPNGEIQIKFSEPMDPATLNNQTIYLTPAQK